MKTVSHDKKFTESPQGDVTQAVIQQKIFTNTWTENPSQNDNRRT